MHLAQYNNSSWFINLSCSSVFALRNANSIQQMALINFKRLPARHFEFQARIIALYEKILASTQSQLSLTIIQNC